MTPLSSKRDNINAPNKTFAFANATFKSKLGPRLPKKTFFLIGKFIYYMGKTELFYGDDSVLASFGYFVGMIHFLCGAINSMPFKNGPTYFFAMCIKHNELSLSRFDLK